MISKLLNSAEKVTKNAMAVNRNDDCIRVTKSSTENVRLQ